MNAKKADPFTKVRTSFQNLKRAFASLSEALSKPSLSDLEAAGTVKHFEFCYELSWKTLQKQAGINGRRVASPREAFQYGREAGLILDDGVWPAMIESRNETVHTYDRESAERILNDVRQRYKAAFAALIAELERTLLTSPQA